MSYRPNPGTECCPGNVNRFMPNYVLNMYHLEDNNLYINLFGESYFEELILGKIVKINQITNFPFDENITIKVDTSGSFNLFIRKPKYASKTTISSDKDLEIVSNEDFYLVKINGSCQINYSFDSEIKVIKTNKNGVYLKKGVLVYSYGMYGDRCIDETEERSSKEFPAYKIYADQEFGYALDLNQLNYKFISRIPKMFDLRDTMPYIEIDAYKITNYDFKKQNKVRRVKVNWFDNTREIKYEKGDFVFTPDILKQKIEISDQKKRIRLYPYGACKIRETVFKLINR